jgi:hypothetical protein
MTASVRVYLESSPKRAFAGAIEWPGWCRAARDEAGALDALVAYADRYVVAIGDEDGWRTPTNAAALEVVERLDGNATTEFGAPGIVPAADDRDLDEAEVERQVRLLRASWAAFDAAAEAARDATLRKGPRGGGRDLPKMIEHVAGADDGYRTKTGGVAPPRDAHGAERMALVRDAIVEAVEARGRGGPAPRESRTTLWSPRYAVRRSAWHALDPAWEIEDRSEAPS